MHFATRPADNVRTHLVIGGYGLIGSALCAELTSRQVPFVATTRRTQQEHAMAFYDLRRSDPASLPPASIVYLVAGMPGFATCEGNRLSWRVNVDAAIALARHYRHSFVIFISTDAVEWCGATAYAREKAQVEPIIHAIDGAIVRPAKVTPERAGEFAKALAEVARARKPGVFRWE